MREAWRHLARALYALDAGDDDAERELIGKAMLAVDRKRLTAESDEARDAAHAARKD